MKMRIITKPQATSRPQIWICSRCGTTNSGGFTKCQECGNRRPW